VVVTLLALNFITVLLLLAIIGREVWHIVQLRQRGARINIQITALFSVVAVVPAVFVALVASVNLNRRLDHQFLIRSRAIMENSAIVSDAYLDDASIRDETNFMAANVALAKRQFDQDIGRCRRQLFTTQTPGTRTTQAVLRNMPVAMSTSLRCSSSADGHRRRPAEGRCHCLSVHTIPTHDAPERAWDADPVQPLFATDSRHWLVARPFSTVAHRRGRHSGRGLVYADRLHACRDGGDGHVLEARVACAI
jgi:hypothetical protein